MFLEAGLPHVNQTAHRRSLSFADAIFTIQDIARHLNSGNKVYMSLYDVQKVEWSMLFIRQAISGGCYYVNLCVRH